MRAFDRDLICGGHYGQRPVCRANRPKTWLHRPACKREENPCQLGAVHTWQNRTYRDHPLLVRFRDEADIVPATAPAMKALRLEFPGPKEVRRHEILKLYAYKPWQHSSCLR